MAKNECFVFEVIDGNDILINGIMNIRDMQVGIFFIDFDIFKIANSIIRNISKQSVIDEFEIVNAPLAKTLNANAIEFEFRAPYASATE